MEKNIVYHGSNVEVSIPRILQNGFYKDFGYGFYCTSFEKQAKRWAMTRKGASVVNHYEYTPNTELKILTFNEMTDEWLDFVADCRRGIEHDYDIVEGPMADDQIWNFVEGFIDGRIPRDAFWGLVRFNYPKMEIASVGNYRKNGKGVALFRRKYPIFYFMKIYFENGRTVADYFKHPVIHNILHGNEEMLYDCICNFNGIRLKK